MAYLDYDGSTTGKVAFLDKIKEMLSEIYTSYITPIDDLAQTMGDTTDEVIAARDGEATLLAKQDAQDLAIAALAAGSGVVISAGDTTAGYVDGKLLAGDYITLTKGNAGANETMTFAGPALVSQADAEAGTGTTVKSWTPERVQQAAAAQTAVDIPSGVIWLWSGSTASIPTGWAICDGTNSTPDLRNKFVVGAGDTYAVAATGGSISHTHTDTLAVDNHTLTEAEMPAHTHSYTTVNWADTSNTQQQPGLSAGAGLATSSTGGDTAHDHNLSGSVTTTTTLPPYYALAYIMKL